MGYYDIGFTEIWISGHWFHLSYQFFPPLARQVEDTNFLKSGYRDIGPPPVQGPRYWGEHPFLALGSDQTPDTNQTLPQ